jgi:hypothetical protein
MYARTNVEAQADLGNRLAERMHIKSEAARTVVREYPRREQTRWRYSDASITGHERNDAQVATSHKLCFGHAEVPATQKMFQIFPRVKPQSRTKTRCAYSVFMALFLESKSAWQKIRAFTFFVYLPTKHKLGV